MIAADINGDKNIDLLISGNAGTAIFYGKGNGTFQPMVTLPGDGTGNGSLESALADFNGDGRHRYCLRYWRTQSLSHGGLPAKC